MPSSVSPDELVSYLFKAAPYISYDTRMATFKGFLFDKRINASCTSEKLADAGFISNGSPKDPSVKCPFCTLEVTFEQFDDPWEKHCEERPNCDFVIAGKAGKDTLSFKSIVNLALRCATVSKYETTLEDIQVLEERDYVKDNSRRRESATKNLINLRNASEFLTHQHRLASYANVKIDQKRIPSITMKTLAKAGFHSTSSTITNTCPSSATCSFCLLQIDIRVTEDAWKEHKEKSPECDFVQLGKLDEKEWSAAEALMLAVRTVVVKHYKKSLIIADDLEKNGKEPNFTENWNTMFLKPTYTRRRCSV